MKIEIDQSGKIEETSKLTVIAFSNHVQRSIMIKSKEKRKLQSEFRKIGKPRAFVYQTFNVMIFVLIKDYLKNIDKIIIDREYTGKETNIRFQLVSLFTKYQIKIDPKIIDFGQIGRKAKAHSVAYLANHHRKANQVITANEILTILLT
ncbi:MAG: hypothetical protein UT11_C0065G0006 [Berkelbacteria bacterium GW2011_GWA2_38_9]|uniref:Uncharacterized protein n=1 Tax=Berkelbacteria bacterium GW2011_GWA2_38_9 TaxID=1618334 RepID=A0A0G0L3V6_9BACT|nr:MAG: hypothetical protein UT11_C0065G0006 [Berkelbacteria bacterium GW2011_GWA2_38_9]